MMKGVYLTGHGGFEKIQYRENIKIPKLNNNEVLIRVCAAGINNTDINTRIGWYSKNNTKGNNKILGTKGMQHTLSKKGSWSGQGIDFPRIQGIDTFGEIINIGSNLLLVPIYGIDGAAVATCISYGIGSYAGLAFFKKSRQAFWMTTLSFNPIGVYKRNFQYPLIHG